MVNAVCVVCECCVLLCIFVCVLRICTVLDYTIVYSKERTPRRLKKYDSKNLPVLIVYCSLVSMYSLIMESEKKRRQMSSVYRSYRAARSECSIDQIPLPSGWPTHALTTKSII